MGGAQLPSRRRFLGILGRIGAAAPLAWLESACFSSTAPELPDPGGTGVLTTRWRAPSLTLEAGTYPLGLGTDRDGYIRLPAGYQPDRSAPLVLLLHGAGGDAAQWSGVFPLLDQLGIVALAVDSRRQSWDLRYGYYGADVTFIDKALEKVFDSCAVDAGRMAICGFSDGASYSLSLGLTNGDLFTHVIAFSPGFIDTDGRRGKPPIYFSHGIADMVLPISFTRSTASLLRSEGYEVDLNEFAGGHEVPEAVAGAAYAWFVGSGVV